MATLGIVMIWAGYTFGVYGYAKIKNAKQVSPPLSFSQLALPSMREQYLVIAQQWSTGSGSSSSNPPLAQTSAGQSIVSGATSAANSATNQKPGTGIPGAIARGG
jgi:hypothetical protein